MSDTTDDPFTPEQLTELVLMQANNSAETVKEPGALADQSLAALVMNALVLHERERINLLDHDTVLPEATRRPKSIRPRGGRQRGSGDQDRLRRRGTGRL
ncbi:hypothetical protein [Bradyrhizobium sp. P5_C11_2]